MTDVRAAVIEMASVLAKRREPVAMTGSVHQTVGDGSHGLAVLQHRPKGEMRRK